MKQYKKLENQLFPLNNRNIQYQSQQPPQNSGVVHKLSSGSLNKYTKSPYLQKFSQGFALPKKINFHNQPNSNLHANQRSKQLEGYTTQSKQLERDQQKISLFKKNDLIGLDIQKKYNPRSKSNMSMSLENKQKTIKFKLPKLDIESTKTEKKQKLSNNTLSATLEVTTKKKKLMPIVTTFKSQALFKTKAGTNGTQTKTNQDIAIVQINLPHQVRLFCVCDGHGLNGHFVSSFIKQHLIKYLTSALKKHTTQPSKIADIFEESLALTNDALLNSDINTQLSGSTVIAVFIHRDIIYSFNIGDSRAILVSQSNQAYTVKPLSNDHKPSRQDQNLRILKFGGRIEAQKNQKGHIIGPLRVWMKDIQMPGLAMTRSFGDKAGIKAGTHGQPQIQIHQITPADKFIVIASDGVWEYLQNDEVMNIIVPFYKKNDIDMAAQKIIRISTQIWQKISYSRDDITVIIVSLNPPDVLTQQSNRQPSPLKYSQTPV